MRTPVAEPPDTAPTPPEGQNARQILDPLDRLAATCRQLARRQGRCGHYSGQLALLEWLAAKLLDGSLATEEGHRLLATRVVTTVQGWVEDMQERE